MNDFRLHAPVVDGNRVLLRWDVSPPSSLYRRTEVVIEFPSGVDLAVIPQGLLDRCAMILLHSHWVLLSPCRVRLPGSLAPGEREAWRRLLVSRFHTLKAHGAGGISTLDVELSEKPGGYPEPPPPPRSARMASAFSSGKDSLLQQALISEVAPNPLLVVTTSPMPPGHDHTALRRRHVLSLMSAFPDCEVMEVLSDFRAAWDNRFPHRLGYAVSVNEITDTHLYLCNLLLAACTKGIGQVFLASEAEVQENTETDGRIIEHPHSMYSSVSLGVFEALLALYGFRIASLTVPLHSHQVQEMLWKAYPEIRSLQYSCWSLSETQSACSACPQCLRLAFTVAAIGGDPAEQGVDLARLLHRQAGWRPRLPAASALPGDTTSAALDAQCVHAIRRTSLRRLLRMILHQRDGECGPRSRALALGGALWLKLRMSLWRGVPSPPGYRPGFLAQVPRAFRDPLRRLFDRHFPAEPDASYADILDRSQRLRGWITEPLRSRLPRGGRS